MKKTVMIFPACAAIAMCLLLAIPGEGLAGDPGFVFGIKPGLFVQSSSFGFVRGPLQPFVGLDVVGLSLDTEQWDGSVMVFIPHLGTKFYLASDRSAGVVVPYVQGDFLFSLSSVKINDLSSAEEDLVKDVLGFWGLSLAFGADYFVSESFSIGGEYGLRYLRGGAEEHREEPLYPGDPGQKVNDEFTIVYKVSYTAVSLNYHF